MNDFETVHQDDTSFLRWWDDVSPFPPHTLTPPYGDLRGSVRVITIDVTACNQRADTLTCERIAASRKFEGL